MQAVTFIFAFVAVLALIVVAAWLVRRFAGNRLGANTSRGRMPRLAIIDAAVIDGRRRLVLVRRDNIEHLVMIGGPTDIVVESNIVRASAGRDQQLPQRPSAVEPPPRIAPLPDTAIWPEPEAARTEEHVPLQMPEPPPRQARPAFVDELRRPPPVMPERRSDPLSGFAQEPLNLRPEPRPEPRSESRPEPRSEAPLPRMPRIDSEAAPPRMPRVDPDAPPLRMPRADSETPPPRMPRADSETPLPRMPRADSETPLPRMPRADSDAPPPRMARIDPDAPPPRMPRADSETPLPRMPRIDPDAPLPRMPRIDPDAPLPRMPRSDQPMPRSARQNEPPKARTAAPPPAPAPPPLPPHSSADQNLAEMAQRLEAALRRPGADPLSPATMPEPPPNRAPHRNEAPIVPPAPAASPKTSFENLEDEMASLLGRPKSSSSS